MKKYRFYCYSEEDTIELPDTVTEEELDEYFSEFLAGVDKGYYEIGEWKDE